MSEKKKVKLLDIFIIHVCSLDFFKYFCNVFSFKLESFLNLKFILFQGYGDIAVTCFFFACSVLYFIDLLIFLRFIQLSSCSFYLLFLSHKNRRKWNTFVYLELNNKKEYRKLLSEYVYSKK